MRPPFAPSAPDPAHPISITDVIAARGRIRPFVERTPALSHPTLDAAVSADLPGGLRVFVKHDNCLPTGAFKVRNGLSALTLLDADARARGVVAATRGNHGLGLAWAGRALGVPVAICVPHGNNPEKNEAIRALGAELIEAGRDYDESVGTALELVERRGLAMVHSTNDKGVLAGAGTLSLEFVEQVRDLEALVIAVGGGSQAVGAITVAREYRRGLQVFAVQAEGAAAIHDSWHAGEPRPRASADTFADGLATRNVYDLTFPALRAGLADFVTVTDAEIADAMRLLLRHTHHLAEPAGAAGLAGLLKLRDRLAGKKVGIVISGGNADEATIKRVVGREI